PLEGSLFCALIWMLIRTRKFRNDQEIWRKLRVADGLGPGFDARARPNGAGTNPRPRRTLHCAAAIWPPRVRGIAPSSSAGQIRRRARHAARHGTEESCDGGPGARIRRGVLQEERLRERHHVLEKSAGGKPRGRRSGAVA